MEFFSSLRKVSERKTEMSSLPARGEPPRRAGKAYQLRATSSGVFFHFYPKSFWGVRGIFSKIPLSPCP